MTGPMLCTGPVSLSPLPSTCFLLLLHFFQVPVQAGEFLLPKAAKGDDPVANVVFFALEGEIVIGTHKHATRLHAPPGNALFLWDSMTREPEVRTFSNGGKVAKFGFAVNNRKKNQSTGEWEDEPVFLDIEAFNRGELGKQADLVEQYLRKGQQVFIEGHLKLDTWTEAPEKGGAKRSKLSVVVENFQYLEPRADGGNRAAFDDRKQRPTVQKACQRMEPVA